MARTAKHNWQKLFLEYNQGRYKSARQFAEAKGLNYDRLKKEFKKLKDQGQNGGEIAPKNEGKKGQNNAPKKTPPKEKGQKLHPWEHLKQQFTDWPEDRLQAYVAQLNARKAELEAIPFEDLTPAEIKELGRVRQERRAILSDPAPEVKCSAHNRDGSPCGNPAERGKRVCWNHGGAPGSGCPPGTQNNLRHGFYSKIMPDDEEIRGIIEEIDAKSPLDMLWEQIVIQYAQIARAQKLMYVRDQEDIVKHLKKAKDGESFTEREWEFQYPWDRHAAFLTAQSKAMATLERLLARYEAMATDEQKLKVQKLKQDMEINRERLQLEKSKVMGDPEETADDGFIEALQGKAGEAWDGYGEETEE